MSLASQVADAFTRVGTEFKTLRGTLGSNASLTTTEKATLVGAINEIKSGLAGAGAPIDDAVPSNSTTYSSNKTNTLLTGKENSIVAGTTAQYLRGDKTWQTLNSAAVGLSNVTNTADSAKPVSSAQQTALDLKAPLASPAFTGTVTGVSKAMVGLANVDNTSDANKPVSSAQATAIAAKPSINDTTASVSTVYSSSKTQGQIDAAVAALVNSSPAALDTLKELSDALGGDAAFATTVSTALGNRLRIDIANQALTGTQQTNGQTNLSVYSKADVGDPATNFVTTFTAALV